MGKYVLLREAMPQSEDHWLQGARRGEEGALGALYDALSPALFRYAYRLVGDEVVAEDIVAETFYRFIRSVGSGGGPDQHLKAYLYRVAHNLIIDRFRRRPTQELNLDWEKLPTSSVEHDPALTTERAFEQARVRRVLWKLTPDQRQVIVLKYFEGLSNQEVSETLGKPVGAVKSLQHRALNALQRMLNLEEE
jgi:RNA polymerase sigma-70 factor (ECF subfamily)